MAREIKGRHAQLGEYVPEGAVTVCGEMYSRLATARFVSLPPPGGWRQRWAGRAGGGWPPALTASPAGTQNRQFRTRFACLVRHRESAQRRSSASGTSVKCSLMTTPTSRVG